MSAAVLKPADFRRRLSAWYRARGRHDLPWRGGGWDPYGILVSELMLQQTGVQTVIPYYRRFLKRFPTFRSLARAPEERVLALWSGLGYYARARNLRRAAQRIVEEHGGRMPRDRATVESLPGIGPYTAGAVLSFAFNAPEALVDGNVIRVLARVDGIRDSVKKASVLKNLWARARGLVPAGGAREHNSALMDLGATVCRPSNPDCGACPLARGCRARRRGQQDRIPASDAESPKKVVHVHAAVIERNGRWLLRRRPSTGLYGGLWEFPGIEFDDPPPAAAVARFLKERFNAVPVSPRPLPGLRHVLSHREIQIHPWRCKTEKPPAGVRGFPARAVERLAVSSLTRKVWRQVRFHV